MLLCVLGRVLRRSVHMRACLPPSALAARYPRLMRWTRSRNLSVARCGAHRPRRTHRMFRGVAHRNGISLFISLVYAPMVVVFSSLHMLRRTLAPHRPLPDPDCIFDSHVRCAGIRTDPFVILGRPDGRAGVCECGSSGLVWFLGHLFRSFSPQYSTP